MTIQDYIRKIPSQEIMIAIKAACTGSHFPSVEKARVAVNASRKNTKLHKAKLIELEKTPEELHFYVEASRMSNGSHSFAKGNTKLLLFRKEAANRVKTQQKLQRSTRRAINESVKTKLKQLKISSKKPIQKTNLRNNKFK